MVETSKRLRRSPKLAYLCCVSLLITLFPTAASAEIYRWVDNKGKVHFSDRKQDDDSQTTVELSVPTSQWKPLDIQVDAPQANLSEAERLRITTDVNHVYRFFDQKLYFDIYKTVPVKIQIFQDEQSYNTYISSRSSAKYGRTSGMYFKKDNAIAVYMKDDRELTFRTIKHETSHAIVDTLTPFVPTWLNEGLAENMETLIAEGNQLFIEHHHNNFNAVKALEKMRGLLGVREFFSLNSNDWTNKNRDGGYRLQVQSGELTRMLLASRPGLSFIVRLIHAYERGDRTIAAYVVEKEYTGGIVVLELNWFRWLERTQLPKISL